MGVTNGWSKGVSRNGYDGRWVGVVTSLYGKVDG